MRCQGYLISFQNYDRENHQINIPTMIALRCEQKDSHSVVVSLIHLLLFLAILSDRGLMLETLALEYIYGGQSAL